MSSLLEIVELANGEIVLQRADAEGDPILSIKFSDEAKAYIGDAQVEVVKAMIQAGIEATSLVQMKEVDAADVDADAVEELLQEEEAQTMKLAAERSTSTSARLSDAANDRVAAYEDKNSNNNISPEQELGPIRASDLASSRILH